MDQSIRLYCEKIDNNKVIEENDIQALIDAWIYGTSTPMTALINALRKTYHFLSNGRTFLYRNKNMELLELNKDNFKNFVLYYFDEFINNSIIEDFIQNKCR